MDHSRDSVRLLLNTDMGMRFCKSRALSTTQREVSRSGYNSSTAIEVTINLARQRLGYEYSYCRLSAVAWDIWWCEGISHLTLGFIWFFMTTRFYIPAKFEMRGQYVYFLHVSFCTYCAFTSYSLEDPYRVNIGIQDLHLHFAISTRCGWIPQTIWLLGYERFRGYTTQR